MAQIAFSALGQAAGSALLPSGLGALGFQISGAAIGQAVGGFVGSRLDGLLFGNTSEGPRLESIRVMESREGAGIANVYGRMRVGGQVIWAARLRETRTTQRAGGGKGGPRVASFTYAASFAVALCEGEINRIARVWANGEIVALSDLPHRLYRGNDAQEPDPLIEAIEGSNCAPAYRGTAYIVFEDLPLEQFGNRLPQLSFEILREVPQIDGASLNAPLSQRVRGVNMIPASGEFVYGTEPVRQHYFPNIETPENARTSTGRTDMMVSLDQLEEDLPLVRDVALTVGWFGDDLRAGHCRIRPGVETRDKDTRPYTWRVNGLDRGEAMLISRGPAFDGDVNVAGPNYGGTPSDRAVVQGIREMSARGMQVTMSPFLLMDIPVGNGLPDPYGRAEQAPFPWRGRITDVDNRAATRTALENFLGHARADDFELDGDEVIWRGARDDFGFRRFILHHAWLSKAAGGVEAFLLASEMRGVTRMRDEAGTFPFVEGLVSLAGEVRSILGEKCKISYAADWTEYGAYVPNDDSQDVLFPLDVFWGDSNVDFVGVDWYAPAGDWRHGDNHLDALAGFEAADDRAYLRSQMAGGEGYDYFYGSDADRAAQIRTPIIDTAHGEHWVFRQKDLLGWHGAQHFERPGGRRADTPTQWQPGSKPIRLSEIGFPALDRGGNSPNLFFDPKSSESAFPPFSTGERDDLYQRAALDVSLSFWQGQDSVEQALVWCWDARPWPIFPIREDIWSDGPNWRFGHWLNGRAGLSELGGVLRDICARGGVDVDASLVTGLVDGFALTGVSSLRGALQPLVTAFGLDVIERYGGLVFSMRDAGPITDIDQAEMTDGGVARTRRLLDKVPGALRLTYSDGGEAYQPASVEARNPRGDRGMVIDVSLPMVLTETRAQAVADFILGQTVEGEGAALGLSYAHLPLEVGDGVRLEDGGVWRVVEVQDQGQIDVQMRVQGRGLATVRAGEPQERTERIAGFAVPGVLVIDGPALPGAIGQTLPLLAGIGHPWPGPVLVSAGGDAAMLSARAELVDPGGVGRLLAPLEAGPLGRWDEASELVLEMPGAQFSSLSEEAVLAGGVPLLVQGQDGWELMAYRDAALIGADQYRLTGLLRGLQGSVIARAETGAVCVVLDERLGRGNVGPGEIGLELSWQAEGRGLFGTLGTERFEDKAGLAFAPVHLCALRGASGVIDVTWVRRGAEISDSWILPEAANAGRFDVQLWRGEDRVFQGTVQAPIWRGETDWQSGDILQVREIGADGRLGRSAEMVL